MLTAQFKMVLRAYPKCHFILIFFNTQVAVFLFLVAKLSQRQQVTVGLINFEKEVAISFQHYFNQLCQATFVG